MQNSSRSLLDYNKSTTYFTLIDSSGESMYGYNGVERVIKEISLYDQSTLLTVLFSELLRPTEQLSELLHAIPQFLFSDSFQIWST